MSAGRMGILGRGKPVAALTTAATAEEEGGVADAFGAVGSAGLGLFREGGDNHVGRSLLCRATGPAGTVQTCRSNIGEPWSRGHRPSLST